MIKNQALDEYFLVGAIIMSVMQQKHMEFYSKFYCGAIVVCFQWQEEQFVVSSANCFSHYVFDIMLEQSTLELLGDSLC